MNWTLEHRMTGYVCLPACLPACLIACTYMRADQRTQGTNGGSSSSERRQRPGGPRYVWWHAHGARRCGGWQRRQGRNHFRAHSQGRADGCLRPPLSHHAHLRCLCVFVCVCLLFLSVSLFVCVSD